MKPHDRTRTEPGNAKEGIALIEALLARDCHRCGGALHEVRRECADGALIVHVRCRGACRGGGHLAYDTIDDVPDQTGPVFPDAVGRTIAGPEAKNRGRAGV